MERPNLARKEALNPEEAIKHFNLSRRKFYDLIQQEGLPFLAYYIQRKLIIRAEFEKYLLEHPELKRRESYGRPKKR